jgi:hypothetical protein
MATLRRNVAMAMKPMSVSTVMGLATSGQQYGS